jgi:hypothetical protein
MGMTGAQVTRKILDQNGFSDVAIREISGVLTDRYDMSTRTVKLSRDNYHSTSIAAIGIAAHEVGHVLQAEARQTDKQRSIFFTPRIASILTQVAGWGAVISLSLIFMGWLFRWSGMMAIGMGIFLVAIGCSFLILPVEWNASRRALALLCSDNYLTKREMDSTKVLLRAASWSYAATVVTVLIQLFRDIIKRDDDYP